MSETPEEKMKHLDEMTCLLYLERQLDRTRGLEVSAHTQECDACRTLMRALERESRLLTRAMLEEDEPLPSRLAQFQERAQRSMQWIWGLVFGLAATGVYALYTGYIQPWQVQLEQAGFGGSNLLGLLIFQGALWKGWQSMITLLEILALVTLGGLGMVFLRKRIRRGSALALVFAGLCAALVVPAPASGSEMRKAESVGVAEGETINGDIFLFGDRIRVDGTVKGDVFLFGHDATVSGHVEGDVFGFSQQLQVNGQVDGNIRAATNTLTIRGNVAKNVLTFDERVNFEPAAKVGGSMTIFVESLALDGSLGRDLLMFGNHLSVSGKVGGGIKMKGAALTINSGAEVDGPIHYEGDNPAEVSAQAKLASPVEFKKLEHKHEYQNKDYYIWRVIWTAAFILFGLVLFMLFPKFGSETIDGAEQVGIPLLLGILVFFGIPIAGVIACFTVVGIPLAVLAMGVWFLMLCCAELVVGTVVGNWILGKGRTNWEIIGRMALGFVIVRIVYTPVSQVHVLGMLAALGIWIWGMGAISLAFYRRFQPIIAPRAPSVPMPPNTTVGGTLPA
jgi:cytoskeletal protein CcmA (bactofilin family)